MPRSTEYLLRDEYIDSRNVQDNRLNKEFHSIHESVDQVKQELKDFKDDVKEFKNEFREFKDDVKEFKNEFKEFKDDVNTRFTRIDERFDDLDLQYRRMAAYSRNNNLRNPTLQITPIVSYQPGRGIVHPDSSLYPRNAKEFYSLRTPNSFRQMRLLMYLISFYDLPYHTWAPGQASDDDDSSQDGDSSPRNPALQGTLTVEDAARDHSDLAVDLLEGILGLNPDNFDKFLQRAAELRQTSPQPMKRHLPAGRIQSDHVPDAGPRKRRDPFAPHTRPLDIRPPNDAAREPLDESTSTRVGWNNHDKSPSMTRKLQALCYPRGHSSDKGTTTNPFTTSQGRESSREAES